MLTLGLCGAMNVVLTFEFFVSTIVNVLLASMHEVSMATSLVINLTNFMDGTIH